MEESKNTNVNIFVSANPKVKITVSKNGPYRVSGDFELVDAEGKPIEHGSNISLCRCGQSNNKPFCDGHHRTVGFLPDLPDG